MLRKVFIALGFLWTLLIIINLLRDLFRAGTNYFGVFFGVLVAIGIILAGNGILFLVYMLVKRLVK